VVEEQIIKLFCDDKNVFTKYYKYVNINYIKINYSNLYKIFITIDNYYNKYNNNNSINKTELELVYNSSYILKDSERKELSDLLDRILKTRVIFIKQIIGVSHMAKRELSI
jgi:hypothetical protein